jgi:hypothetical protein
MREKVGKERIRQLWMESRRVVKGTGSRHRITTATPMSSRGINRALDRSIKRYLYRYLGCSRRAALLDHFQRPVLQQ